MPNDYNFSFDARYDLIIINNDGKKIISTNYWDTNFSHAGLFYMSGNAGAWRLLVPESQRFAIAEFATARFVEIDLIRCDGRPCVALWFEDGSDCPYRLLIDQRQLDRTMMPTSKRLPFLIYTREGLAQTTTIRKILRLNWHEWSRSACSSS